MSSSGSVDLNIDGLHMASGEAGSNKGQDSPRTIMIRANMLKVSLPTSPSCLAPSLSPLHPISVKALQMPRLLKHNLGSPRACVIQSPLLQ